MLNVCLPYLTSDAGKHHGQIESNTGIFESIEKDEQQYTETIEALISKAPMPIKAVLGNSSISVNDFGTGRRYPTGYKGGSELSVFVGSIKI